MSGIELQGMETVLAEMRRRLGNASERVVNKGLRSGGEIIRQETSARAPRSDIPRKPGGKQTWRTGKHAADNIKLSKITKEDGMRVIRIGIQRGDTHKYFYLKFFEFGTSKMPAKPFVEPAFHARKKDALLKMAEEFSKGLRE